VLSFGFFGWGGEETHKSVSVIFFAFPINQTTRQQEEEEGESPLAAAKREELWPLAPPSSFLCICYAIRVSLCFIFYFQPFFLQDVFSLPYRRERTGTSHDPWVDFCTLEDILCAQCHKYF